MVKKLNVTFAKDFDSAIKVAKETTFQFNWYAPKELNNVRKSHLELSMHYIITDSLEAYCYHNNEGYNYMTKVEAGGILSNDRPHICILKKDGLLLFTDLTVNGTEDTFLRIAKLTYEHPTALKFGFSIHNIEIEKGDIIIWTKETMEPKSYHKNEK
jgi:hypothetical protein